MKKSWKDNNTLLREKSFYDSLDDETKGFIDDFIDKSIHNNLKYDPDRYYQENGYYDNRYFKADFCYDNKELKDKAYEYFEDVSSDADIIPVEKDDNTITIYHPLYSPLSLRNLNDKGFFQIKKDEEYKEELIPFFMRYEDSKSSNSPQWKECPMEEYIEVERDFYR